MNNKWVNIYPLLAKKENVLSCWVNANAIETIDILKYEDNTLGIRVIHTGGIFSEYYDNENDALAIWESLKDAVGVKRQYKRGSKKKVYERLNDQR